MMLTMAGYKNEGKQVDNAPLETNLFVEAVENGLADIEQGRVITDEELDRALDDLENISL